MIRFQKLLINNFMALGEVELDFTSGTRLLLGKNEDSLAADDNGAGKSSIGEALRWVLYGTTVRAAIDKTLDVQHVIREGAKQARVILIAEADHLPLRVERNRAKSKATLTVEYGGNPHEGKAAQAVLDAVLGVDEVQFANLVHLDGSYPKLFAPSTDRDRKDILADLVDISIVNMMQGEADLRLSPILTQIDGIKQKRVRLTTEQELLKDNKLKAKKEGVALKKECDALSEDWERLHGEWEDAEDVFLTLEEGKKKFELGQQKQIVEARGKLEEAKADVAEAEAQVQNANDLYLMSEVEETTTKLNSVENQLNICNADIARRKKLQDQGKCTECGQDTTEVGQSDIDLLTSQIERLQSEFSENQAACTYLEKERQANLKQLREHRVKVTAQRDALQTALEDLLASKERESIFSEFAAAERALNEAATRVNEVKANVQSRKALLGRAKETWDKAKERLAYLKETLAGAELEAKELDRQAERLDFWRKGFGPKGVPSLFIETVLPQISKRIQRYADILTGGDVIVTLRAFRETKSKTIQESIQISATNNKGAAVYGSNSTGERNRIDLAVTLGLIDYFRDTNVFESNLLVCDEIFDGLDATGVEQALIALEEAGIDSVIVVSHHEHLKPLFPETMYVVKKEGVSSLAPH